LFSTTTHIKVAEFFVGITHDSDGNISILSMCFTPEDRTETPREQIRTAWCNNHQVPKSQTHLGTNIASSTLTLDNNDDDGFVLILFEITVDAINLQTVSFVDINQYLDDKNKERIDEFEFLYTIGSIFKVINMT
jgi:hypothetical protein